MPGNLPHAPDFGYGLMLLRSGIARTVLDPMSGAFGPMQGEPAGVYRMQRRAPNDARCAPYAALRDKVERWSTPERRPELGRQPCPSYEYVGPFDERPRKDMYATFVDSEAWRRGFTREGAVLIVDGEIRTTEIRYRAVSRHGASELSGWWGVKACAPSGTEIVNGPPQP